MGRGKDSERKEGDNRGGCVDISIVYSTTVKNKQPRDIQLRALAWHAWEKAKTLIS